MLIARVVVVGLKGAFWRRREVVWDRREEDVVVGLLVRVRERKVERRLVRGGMMGGNGGALIVLWLWDAGDLVGDGMGSLEIILKFEMMSGLVDAVAVFAWRA